MPLVLGIRSPLAGLLAARKPQLGLLDESRVRMRVHATDCDINLHINNGRYLSLMDIGRTDVAARCGLKRVFRERGWHVVAAGETIRFRRELRLWSRYTLVTRYVGWADGWCFFEQVFERGDGALAARAYVKVAVLDRDGGRIDGGDVARALDLDPISPELPASLEAWRASDHG